MGVHQYHVFIKDSINDIVWEIQPKRFSFKDELNHESTGQMSVSFQDFKKIADATGTTVMSVFTAAFREVWIERDDVKIFWGVISGNFGIEPTKDGELTVRFDIVSWFGLFQKRIAGVPKRVFTSTDAGEIAWTLIDESQSSDSPYSDFGITEGSITASKDRDRTYRFDKIKDQIVNLSNDNLADGFDFDIDNTKAFNVYYPTKGSNRFNIVFDLTTLASFSYEKPLLLELTNKIHVTGSGDNDNVLYATRTAATGYRTSWHTLEDVSRQGEITEVTTLEDHGDRALANGQTPVVQFRADHYDDQIEWDDYNTGDNVKVNIPDLGFENETKRVVVREFTMDEEKSIGFIKSTLK